MTSCVATQFFLLPRLHSHQSILLTAPKTPHRSTFFYNNYLKQNLFKHLQTLDLPKSCKPCSPLAQLKHQESIEFFWVHPVPKCSINPRTPTTSASAEMITGIDLRSSAFIIGPGALSFGSMKFKWHSEINTFYVLFDVCNGILMYHIWFTCVFLIQML